jgi:hypothetical protein
MRSRCNQTHIVIWLVGIQKLALEIRLMKSSAKWDSGTTFSCTNTKDSDAFGINIHLFKYMQ